MFKEAYVQEVLIDPSLYPFADINDKEAEKPEDNLLTSETITRGEILLAPYNSCVAVLVEDADAAEILAYPLLQDHLSLPLKAGEHVWVVQIGSRYFWLCRRNFDQRVDDVSLSWAGRFGSQSTGPENTADASDSAAGKTTKSPTNNNAKLEKKYPFEKQKPEDVTLEEYWSTRSKHASEAVPAYKKKPGDLVLQGSNNTLICLGSGGGHKKEDDVNLETPSLATVKNEPGTGTIDLVTGRGRYAPVKATSGEDIGDPPIRTGLFKAISAFKYSERDKAVALNNPDQKPNLPEGDADFGYDASRIYISSNMLPDTDFTLVPNYPKIPKVLGASPAEIDPAAAIGSGIVLKSDNIRIISRYHVYGDLDGDGVADGTDVNGNIRIVKEGTRDDKGHSTTDGKGASLISLESDGTMMIDAATIVIGTGRETDNGTGDQIFLGAEATEPIVLGTQLKEILTDFWTALQKFLSDKYDNHIHPVGSGACSPPEGFNKDDAGTQAAIDNIDKILSKIGKTK